MSWQQYARELAVEVVGGILTAAVFAISIYIWPSLKKCLSKTGAACYRAGSKIYTSLSGISFHDAAKRKLTTLAQVAVAGVAKIAVFCFWSFMIYLQVNHMTERANTVRPNGAPAATYISASDDYATPAGSVYSARTVGREWGAGVSARDCTTRYGVRPRYAAPSALPAADQTPCPFARKGGKAKRDARPCATGNTPVVLSTGYSIDDGPL